MLVGVISDTHGLLRPEAIDALRGSELIVHAGDVGDAHVLEHLHAIAPTVAVRGNIDTGQWARALSPTEVVDVEDLHLYVLHDLTTLDLDAKPQDSPPSSPDTPIAPAPRRATACCI